MDQETRQILAQTIDNQRIIISKLDVISKTLVDLANVFLKYDKAYSEAIVKEGNEK